MNNIKKMYLVKKGGGWFSMVYDRSSIFGPSKKKKRSFGPLAYDSEDYYEDIVDYGHEDEDE